MLVLTAKPGDYFRIGTRTKLTFVGFIDLRGEDEGTSDVHLILSNPDLTLEVQMSEGHWFMVDGVIKVEVCRYQNDQIRLGFVASKEIKIFRSGVPQKEGDVWAPEAKPENVRAADPAEFAPRLSNQTSGEKVGSTLPLNRPLITVPMDPE